MVGKAKFEVLDVDLDKVKKPEEKPQDRYVRCPRAACNWRFKIRGLMGTVVERNCPGCGRDVEVHVPKVNQS